MPGILIKTARFSNVERYVFTGEFFRGDNKDKNLSNLYITLQYANSNDKEAFYRGMPEQAIEWWEGQIRKVKENRKSGEAGPDRIAAAETAISAIIESVMEKTETLERNSESMRKVVRQNREVMKSGFAFLHNFISDQARGLEVSIKKDYDKKNEIIPLLMPDESVLKKANILDCITARKSRRKYSGENLTLAELSYLLWATQGVKKELGGKSSIRTVPSGGSRHPFETYLAVNRVKGVKAGVYRYLPFEHKLVFLFSEKNMAEKLTEGALGQPFAGNSAVTFIWSAIPYRCEWRYTLEAKKIILQDSGHVCQNLYLACESILCGTVAVGAYDQDLMDGFLKLDGQDEFVVYMAPVGKLEAED